MPAVKSITINFDNNITQVEYGGGQVIWTTSGESHSHFDWSGEFTCVLNEGYIIDTITTSSDIAITNKTNTTFHITTENVSTGIITITSKKASSGAKIIRLINENDLQAIEITTPENGTNGTLTDEQLAVLTHSNSNYIILNKECYYLADNEHMSGYRVYSHVGYESSTYFTKCITITLSTKAWVLTQTSPQNFVSSEEIVVSGNKLMLSNAVSNKVNNSLQMPTTQPTELLMVGLNTSKAQTNIPLGNSLKLENGHLETTIKIVKKTQSEYDNLTSYDENTMYVIVG